MSLLRQGYAGQGHEEDREPVGRLWRLLIYAVAAVGCGLAVGANSPEHSWLRTLLGAAAMIGVLYALERTGQQG